LSVEYGGDGVMVWLWLSGGCSRTELCGCRPTSPVSACISV